MAVKDEIKKLFKGLTKDERKELIEELSGCKEITCSF
jgi:hypothetical protein